MKYYIPKYQIPAGPLVNKDLPNKVLNTAKFIFNDVLPIVSNPISTVITSAVKGNYNSNSPLYKQIAQTLVQPIARKIGRTPSGFAIDIPNIVKELGNNETTRYVDSFPSQDAYYYGSEKYFPKATHEPRINPSIKQHDVNFGRNVFEIPKQDSINFVNNLNNTIVARQGYPINEEFRVVNDINSDPYFYDAGNHTLIPKKDKNGNYFVYLNDVYDFDPKQATHYVEKYSRDQKDNKTPNWVKPIALEAMTLMGEPYEVHQTVPVKFVNKQINEQTEITSANVRDMFKNVLKLHNVELIKPVDSFSEDEIRQMFVSGSGDDLVQHWRNLNLVKE